MSIKTKAESNAEYFLKLINNKINKKNNKELLLFLLEEHFHYSRYYGNSWVIPFHDKLNSSIEELNIENEDFKNDIISIFNYELKITELYFSNIDYIYNNKKIRPSFFNYDSDLPLIHYLIDYKIYILSKHLYSCIYNFYMIYGFENKKDIFKLINNESLNGQVFYNKNKELCFKVPIGKSSCFLFKHKDLLYGIDVNISSNINSLFVIPHFIHTHDIYSQDYTTLKSNIKENELNNLDLLLEKYSKEKIIKEGFLKEISTTNINYILCFENEPNYHNISISDYKILNLLSIEIHDIYHFKIPSDVHRIIFNHLSSTSNNENISLEKRDYSISNIINYLSSGTINQISNKLTDRDKSLVHNIIVNKLSMIINDMDKDSFRLIDFIKACNKNQINNIDVAENLYSYFINHESFYKYKGYNIKNIVSFREKLCKRYIEYMIFNLSNKKEDFDLIIKKVIKINPSTNVKKLRSKLKKL